MINKKKETKAYQDAFQKALKIIQQSGYDSESIKADFEGYEQPSKLTNQASEVSFIPDITVTSNGSKSYYEISHKTDDATLLASKWKLLETMASVKSGTFKVFAPKGHIKFTEEFVSKNNIDAEIIKI